jgi:hypothetical protein
MIKEMQTKYNDFFDRFRAAIGLFKTGSVRHIYELTATVQSLVFNKTMVNGFNQKVEAEEKLFTELMQFRGDYYTSTYINDETIRKLFMQWFFKS